jgi:DNA-binding MarR family transcriptional regulator
MTGIAKRLENGGFAIRKGDAGDERVKLLEITPRGKKTLKDIKAEKEQHITNFLKNCSDNHKKLLLSNIRKILTQNIS